jgi:hypothetical protein
LPDTIKGTIIIYPYEKVSLNISAQINKINQMGMHKLSNYLKLVI